MLITSIILLFVGGFLLRAGIGNLIKALISAMAQIKEGSKLYVNYEISILYTVFGFISLGIGVAFLTAYLL